tara:strand:+ start:12084 stop:12830 length:747 start_codon:yes stop_codon:yes gene_type:complete
MEHLRISTMTAVSKLSDDINLQNLYDNLNINDIVKYIEFKENEPKGFSKKSLRKTRKKTIRKTFYNQATIHIHHKDKVVNVKVFKNGNIQMTGLKYQDQGKEVLQLVIEQLMRNNRGIFEKDELDVLYYKIVLINSDFDIKYKVDREKLHREIIRLGLYSTYEPCMYPGVNIKYYFNNIYNKCGICKCDCKCSGKGEGLREGDCKKVTIAVFNSGKIIITGGKSTEQLVESYDFITNVLSDREKFHMK